METLVGWDQALFSWLNAHHSPLWDEVWWYLSQTWVWLPLFGLLAWVAWQRYRRAALWVVLAFGLAVGASDYTASGILKPLVNRTRPCNEPALAGTVHTVNGYCSGAPSFASSHAANSACVAVLSLLLLARGRRWLVPMVLAFWVLHSYSRIYLGVHYPGDILGGTLIGVTFACLLFILTKKATPLRLHL